MQTFLIRYIGLALIIIAASFQTQASVFLHSADIHIFRDSSDLSFSELQALESGDQELFTPFEGLNRNERVFWIKITHPRLVGGGYLLLSNFFEKTEAFYPTDNSRYSLSGSLVDFEDREYYSGFYRNVLPLAKNQETLYVKITSLHAYSFINQSLSHLEIVSKAELESFQSQLDTASLLLIGMELVILIIHLFLFYLKRSKTVIAYSSLIMFGVLFVLFKNQLLIDQLGISAGFLQYADMFVNIFLIYCFLAFTAYYLDFKRYAKTLHRYFTFPIGLIIFITAFFWDGQLFPILATSYFLISLLCIIYFLTRNFNENREKSTLYILANLVAITLASSIILALNDIIPHRFLTTNIAFVGFVLRDIIFTSDIVRAYLRSSQETQRQEFAIKKLTQEKEQIRALEELKARFFNDVSHDLRTPLTLILSPLEQVIKNQGLSDEVKKELSLSLKNGKYLQQLVDEILSLSKLDGGELKMKREGIEVVTKIQDLLDSFRKYAELNQQKLYISYDDSSVIALLDKDKFEKIIINLLSNAIKYSEGSGEINITIKKEATDLIITIADQGIGIPKEDLSRIFDRFYTIREDHQLSTAVEGLGLAIVKEYVSLHGGRIEVDSERRKGSIFTIRLPDCIEEEVADEPSLKAGKRSGKQAGSILLVEDHDDMRHYLKDKFTEYEVVTAANGKDATDKLMGGFMPDLILTDYSMPVMDGYAMAEQLVQDEKFSHLPIIFLTARTLMEDKMKVLRLGIDDYIVKPFDMEELKLRVEHAINISHNRKAPTLPKIGLDDEVSFKHELDEYILANLKNSRLSIVDIANKFSSSERNMHRKIKKVCGQPPASYVREIRLQKAKMMLEVSNKKSVTEVANACGIENTTHFSQLFKKRFGVSPNRIERGN